MSLVEKAALGLQDFDRKAWPSHRVMVTPLMSRALSTSPLVIADVGAVGGPEARWAQLKGLVHFVGFDPLVPGQEGIVDGIKRTNIQAALGGGKQSAQLRLMRDPHASTICEPHLENFADFVIHKGLEQTGSVSVELDSLDGSLTGHPELKPHFLTMTIALER